MSTVNGVDVNKLNNLIDFFRTNPEVANLEFRAETEWVNGAHSMTQIRTSRGETFTLEADEPPILLGTDLAPNAVQAMLHALASCLIVSFVYNAAACNINLRSLKLALEGDLDLHAFLGISEDVRPGYQNIRIKFKVESDAPRDKIEELLEHAQRTSLVVDIVRNGVPVHISLEKGIEAVKMRAKAAEADEVSSSDQFVSRWL
ncbi:OsmC family protein [Candidatus Methanoperedens nitratireducens]|uniref:OsmC family protein n=1 Tax=Candidatus Methanoperedens nitratireducens TaxID=1392998 RepID=A0A284VQQ6_9EURY|nr:OsmC family protein [Candidatus Methanoperedens nitroreducens]SNQ61538.1 OsmC family protein [Candidatus Methanoperedens nitroreducens]